MSHAAEEIRRAEKHAQQGVIKTAEKTETFGVFPGDAGRFRTGCVPFRHVRTRIGAVLSECVMHIGRLIRGGAGRRNVSPVFRRVRSFVLRGGSGVASGGRRGGGGVR